MMNFILTFFIKYKKVFLASGVVALIIHIVFFQSINSVMLVPFILYWMFLGMIYRLHERYFFGIALFFLVLSAGMFLLGKFAYAEKFSVWQFLFLIMGLVQWFLFDVLLSKYTKK